jgi:DNA polymerase
VLKCRPPGNRDPQPGEVESCRPYLEQQLDLIRPRLVVALGNFAAKLMTGTQTGITRLREKRFTQPHGTLLCTFHPAAALRGGGAADGIAKDFEKIRDVLAEQPEPTEDPAEQLGLFG